MSNYAKANTTAQWFAKAYPGATINPNCGVIHTTEGTSWDGYQGGAVAPNYTAKPDIANQHLDWRAHFPDEMSSRALVNAPGGVDTNTANAVQVELVGTCDYTKRETWNGLKAGRDYIYWPDAPEWALRDLAAFLLDMKNRHGIPLSGPSVWLNYGPDPRRVDGRQPASYGANGVRLTFTQWRAFTGWCGHQHVPENDHGDPGALPFTRLLALANGTTIAPQEDDMPLTKDDATTVWSGSAIVKNVTAANPDTAPRVAPSFLLELAARNSVTTVGQLAGLTAAIKALAESKPGVNADDVLATVKASVDAGVAAALADLTVTLDTKEN